MTNRSKVIFLSSLLLAICVIVSAIMLIIAGRGTSSSTSTTAIAASIIFISMMSVILIYFTKIKRRHDEIKLNESFFREFEIIKDIVTSSTLPRHYKKSILEDVLEILLTAQTAGRSVDSSIGDAESFAKDIIDACIGKPHTIINSLIDGAIAFILFMLLITSLLWIEDISQGFFNQSIDISMILFCAVISFALIPMIRLLIFRKSPWAYVIPLFSGLCFIGIIKLLRFYFYEANVIKILLDGTFIMIPNIVVFVFLFAVLILLFAARISIRRLPKLQ